MIAKKDINEVTLLENGGLRQSGTILPPLSDAPIGGKAGLMVATFGSSGLAPPGCVSRCRVAGVTRRIIGSGGRMGHAAEAAGKSPVALRDDSALV